mgnify:CR=1 FL=1
MLDGLKKNTEEGAIVEWDKTRLQSTNYHKALFLTAFETWKINKKLLKNPVRQKRWVNENILMKLLKFQLHSPHPNASRST